MEAVRGTFEPKVHTKCSCPPRGSRQFGRAMLLMSNLLRFQARSVACEA